MIIGAPLSDRIGRRPASRPLVLGPKEASCNRSNSSQDEATGPSTRCKRVSRDSSKVGNLRCCSYILQDKVLLACQLLLVVSTFACACAANYDWRLGPVGAVQQPLESYESLTSNQNSGRLRFLFGRALQGLSQAQRAELLRYAAGNLGSHAESRNGGNLQCVGS